MRPFGILRSRSLESNRSESASAGRLLPWTNHLQPY
ncbi:hypothetical protein MPTK1_2g25000 [Marchantia polymorpha subsp. ruderalis]